jgi:hypothetical protein
MSDYTPRVALPYLSVAQAQKELAHNAALNKLDVLTQPTAEAKQNGPPASPVNGQVYIVDSAPTGVWATKAGYIAYYLNGWFYYAPFIGMQFFNVAEDCFYVYRNSLWEAASGAGAVVHNDLSGRTSADAHPMSSITGLSTAIITAHNDLSGRTSVDAHPLDAITGLGIILTASTDHITDDLLHVPAPGTTNNTKVLTIVDEIPVWRSPAAGAGTGDMLVITYDTDADGKVNEADIADTVIDKAITNAKLADVATGIIKGRKTAAAGVVEDLTVDDVKTLLGIIDGRMVTVDSTVAINDLLYLKSTGEYGKAIATALTSMQNIVIAVEAGTGSKRVLDRGVVSGFIGLTVGGSIFVGDTTAGLFTQTAPTTAGNYVKCVGWALSATSIIFAPDTLSIQI